MKKVLSLIDRTVLGTLSMTQNTATHWPARQLYALKLHKHPDNTAKTRNVLRRLARWGYVVGVTWHGDTVVRYWRITQDGAEALEGLKSA